MSSAGGVPPGWVGARNPQVPASPAAGDFALGANDVRVVRIPLDTANVRKLYSLTGNALWAVDASSRTAAMRVHLNDTSDDGIPVRQGFAMRTPPFSRLYIESDAQAGEWIDVVLFVAQFDFFIVNPGESVATVSLAKASGGDNVRVPITVGAPNTAVLASDADRRAAVIKNEGPDSVRIGWSAVATHTVSDTQGISLGVGESITLEGTKGIEARVASGGTASVVNVVTILD